MREHFIMPGVEKLWSCTSRASLSQRASQLECHPHLGVGENAPPVLLALNSPLYRLLLGQPRPGFDGDDGAIFTKIIQPPAQPKKTLGS